MNVLSVPRQQWVLYSVSLVLIVLAVAGLTRLQTEANYRVYFDPDDPLLALEAKVNRHFQRSDAAVLVVQAGAEPIWSPQTVAAYQRFEGALSALSFVTRVSGFYRFIDGGGLPGEPSVADDPFADTVTEPSGSDDVTAVSQRRMQRHPLARDLVSADGRFGLIVAQVAFAPGDSARQVQQAMTEIRRLADELVASGVARGVSYSGALALNHAYIEVVRHDLLVFVPGLLGVLALVLYLLLRSWRLALLPLLSGLIVALMALGIAGWAGWTLAAINAFTPIIIISLHLAATMHLVVNWLQQCAAGLAAVPAMRASLRFNRAPMVLSAATTAAGFLLLGLSPSPPIRVVGYCVAIGVTLSLLVNLVLLPPVLIRFALPSARARSTAARLRAEPLLVWLSVQRKRVAILALVLGTVALALLSRAQINDSVYDYFPPDNGFTQGSTQLDQHFTGCVRLSYVVSSAGGSDEDIWHPTFSAAQATFVAWLRTQPEVAGVSDVLALLPYYGLDVARARALLQEHSLSALGLTDFVSEDRAAIRVEVALRTLSSRELIAFDERVQQWLSAHPGALQVEGGSGPDLIFAWLGQRNARSMFMSLGIALVAIGLLVGLLFRDPALALLGMLCNLLPLLLVYALWFASGGYISLGAAVVMGMIMGVVVDDTLHLLCKYRRLAHDGAADPVLRLGRQVLPAVFITSLTLASGLLLGLLSDFRPLRELGLLSAAIIVAAMLVDGILLPALLLMRAPGGEGKAALPEGDSGSALINRTGR